MRFLYLISFLLIISNIYSQPISLTFDGDSTENKYIHTPSNIPYKVTKGKTGQGLSIDSSWIDLSNLLQKDSSFSCSFWFFPKDTPTKLIKLNASNSDEIYVKSKSGTIFISTLSVGAIGNFKVQPNQWNKVELTYIIEDAILSISINKKTPIKIEQINSLSNFTIGYSKYGQNKGIIDDVQYKILPKEIIPKEQTVKDKLPKEVIKTSCGRAIFLHVWDGGEVDGDEIEIYNAEDKSLTQESIKLRAKKLKLPLDLKEGLNVFKVKCISSGKAHTNTVSMSFIKERSKFRNILVKPHSFNLSLKKDEYEYFIVDCDPKSIENFKGEADENLKNYANWRSRIKKQPRNLPRNPSPSTTDSSSPDETKPSEPNQPKPQNNDSTNDNNPNPPKPIAKPVIKPIATLRLNTQLTNFRYYSNKPLKFKVQFDSTKWIDLQSISNEQQKIFFFKEGTHFIKIKPTSTIEDNTILSLQIKDGASQEPTENPFRLHLAKNIDSTYLFQIEQEKQTSTIGIVDKVVVVPVNSRSISMYVKTSKNSRVVDDDVFQIQINGKNIASENGTMTITKNKQRVPIIMEKDQTIINFIHENEGKSPTVKCEVTLEIGAEPWNNGEPIQISIPEKGQESRIILIYNNQ